jgi:hypothetical protein
MALPIVCLEYVRKASKRWIGGCFDEISPHQRWPSPPTLRPYDSQTGLGETADSLANPLGTKRGKPRSQNVLGAIGFARAICACCHLSQKAGSSGRLASANCSN